MKNITTHYIKITIVSILIMMLIIGCIATSKNFLVGTISQQFDENRRLNTILSGFVSYDELSSNLKNKMAALGYKSNESVPAVCIIHGSSETGIIYLPKSSESNTSKINLQDWINIGEYKPLLIDNFKDWSNRNK